MGLDEQRHNKVSPRERHQGLAEHRQHGGLFRPGSAVPQRAVTRQSLRARLPNDGVDPVVVCGSCGLHAGFVATVAGAGAANYAIPSG